MNKRRVKRRRSSSTRDTLIRPVASKSKLEQFSEKYSFKIFLIMVAVVGFFSAFRFGAASLDYYHVRNAIEQWQDSGELDNIEHYLSVKNAIQTARALHKSNPLYMDLSGQVIEWGVISGFESDIQLLNAKQDYLAASKVRPLWPSTWANLAMIKWRLQEFDDEMLTFLRKANNYGSQTPEVHMLFSRLGVSLYKSNHPMYTEFKDAIRNHIRLGLRNENLNQELVDYITLSNALGDVCRWLMPDSPATATKHLGCE